MNLLKLNIQGENNMPLVLSDSRTPEMESLRKNRWLMQFAAIPGSAGDSNENLSFVAVSAVAPSISFEQKEYFRLNERFYTAGRPSWNEIPMTFYDFISGPQSAAQILYNWSTKIYNPLTGAMAFKKEYTTTGTLAMLDPAGNPVRVWNLYYLWPFTVNFGEGLEASSDDINTISVSFRYDFAIKQADINTAPTT